MYYSLTITAFNICTNNLTIILNRIENAKNFSLRIVKAVKEKGNYREISKLQNVENDANTWTLKKCNEYLKENNMIRVGNLNDLRK